MVLEVTWNTINKVLSTITHDRTWNVLDRHLHNDQAGNTLQIIAEWLVERQKCAQWHTQKVIMKAKLHRLENQKVNQV